MLALDFLGGPVVVDLHEADPAVALRQVELGELARGADGRSDEGAVVLGRGVAAVHRLVPRATGEQQHLLVLAHDQETQPIDRVGVWATTSAERVLANERNTHVKLDGHGRAVDRYERPVHRLVRHVGQAAGAVEIQVDGRGLVQRKRRKLLRVQPWDVQMRKVLHNVEALVHHLERGVAAMGRGHGRERETAHVIGLAGLGRRGLAGRRRAAGRGLARGRLRGAVAVTVGAALTRCTLTVGAALAHTVAVAAAGTATTWRQRIAARRRGRAAATCAGAFWGDGARVRARDVAAKGATCARASVVAAVAATSRIGR